MLGEDRYLRAADCGASLYAFDSPVSWLQGGCDGCVFLDDAEARWTTERYADDDIALRDWWKEAS